VDRAPGSRRADPHGAQVRPGGSTLSSLLPSIPAWELVVRAVLIYVALLVALRIFGKREVGQFTLYDLVFILLVANALQPAITGPDNSLGGGLVLILALVLTNAGVSWIDRFPRFHRLLAAPPAVIIKDGEYLLDVMKKEGVDKEEAETAMREHGVADVKEVQLGVLEPDGSISIVAPGNATRTKRKVRFRQRSR
jgi:uncharacterized membrane protein YcaP (DUF421 family)